jgi:hypothetical protein
MSYYALLMMINWWKFALILWKLNFTHIEILNDIACNLNSNWIEWNLELNWMKSWIELNEILNWIELNLNQFIKFLKFNLNLNEFNSNSIRFQFNWKLNGMQIGVKGI